MEVNRMALIDKEHLSELKTAAEVKEVASGAAFEIEMRTIASAINTAANTGQQSCTYTNVISKEARAKLLANGYRITKVNGFNAALTISWEAPTNVDATDEGSESTDEQEQQ